jgi:hypothetical protein
MICFAVDLEPFREMGLIWSIDETVVVKILLSGRRGKISKAVGWGLKGTELYNQTYNPSKKHGMGHRETPE